MKFPNANYLEKHGHSLLESSNIDLLKQEVEKTLGRKILFSADCHFLQAHIYKQLHFSVSFNTLRRFFRLMETKYQQSVYTLDVLANYCGYPSFNDFVINKRQHQQTSIKHPNSLFTNYLVTIFKSIEVKSEYDDTYLNLVGQTIQFLEHEPCYFDEFQREIARTRNGQNIYFEKFIYVDRLNSYYGDGIQYYLRENKTTEAQIFGHSLLCFRNWLVGNAAGVEHHYNELSKYEPGCMNSSGINGCFFASQLFYANAFNRQHASILREAEVYYSSLKSAEENPSEIVQFIKFLAQALLLTTHYEQALYYTEEAIGRKYQIIPECDLGTFEAIELFNAFAKMHIGEMDSAKELLSFIIPDNFYFLHKRYLTILYLTLQQKLQKKVQHQEQIQNLIHETGFVKLSF